MTKERLCVASLGVLLVITMLSLTRCTSMAPQSSDMEWPPSLSTLVKQAPTIAFCELVNHPDQFNKKIVRTQAIFYVNSENSVLYDPACDYEETATWAMYDVSFVYSDKDIRKTLDKLLCAINPCPNGKARVVVVGRFEGPSENGYGHLNGYRFKFDIMRVEQAEPLTFVEAKSR